MRFAQIAVFFLFWSLLSCETSNIGSEDKVARDDFSLVNTKTMNTEIDTVSIDSVFLQELELAYMNEGIIWGDETESNPPEGSEGMYCKVSLKLKFNTDTIEDYFLTEYESRFSYSYIIDGRTGRKIPFTHDSLILNDIHTMFWHRPTDNGVIATVVNINCSDDREELMVNYTKGFNGFGNYLLLYRYNERTNEVDLIFQHTIYEEVILNKTKKITSVTLNYIDILYNTPICITEINIKPGRSAKPIDYQFNYLDINPLQDVNPETYIFNDETNLFEPHF